MVGHGNRNTSFTLGTIRRSGRIALRSVDIEGPEALPSTENRTASTGQRERMGNSQFQNHHFDKDDNSNRNDEVQNMDDASEDPNKLHYELEHITKLRSAPNGMLSRMNGKSQNGYVSTLSMLAGREANISGRGKFSVADCCHVASRYLPSCGPDIMDTMDSRAYIGQFSADGSLFVTGFQDHRIRIYNVENGWTIQKDVLARNLRWTITDTSLSPDQRYLVYATITPIVHIVNVGSSVRESLANVTEIHEALDFSMYEEHCSFGIFCVKFSTDGRELVAGSNDKSIYVYDLETNRRSLKIPAHEDDVNTVSFADDTSHLIYSGSDDSYCKVWDRRCLSSRAQPAGTLAGHLEGITFIDSRGDGRYFISNGKDQTTKMWDIRKMTAGNPSIKSRSSSGNEWDYRWMEYPKNRKNAKHPYDQSLMTYRGHAVLRTLVRCYFSPSFSTGQKYIYTGSHDGCVYIYDVVSGNLIKKLDYHRSTVRDCSWHPFYPTLVSCSWDGVVAKWDHSTAKSRRSRSP